MSNGQVKHEHLSHTVNGDSAKQREKNTEQATVTKLKEQVTFLQEQLAKQEEINASTHDSLQVQKKLEQQKAFLESQNQKQYKELQESQKQYQRLENDFQNLMRTKCWESVQQLLQKNQTIKDLKTKIERYDKIFCDVEHRLQHRNDSSGNKVHTPPSILSSAAVTSNSTDLKYVVAGLEHLIRNN